MTIALEIKPLPLQIDQNGTIYVTETRIPLDTIVYAYLNGDSAEEIFENYDSLQLADVYSIISFYLDQKKEVEAYLKQREKESQIIKKKIESQFPQNGLRQRLLSRQKTND